MLRFFFWLGLALTFAIPKAQAKEGNYFALDFGAHGSNLTERFEVEETHRKQVSSILGWLRVRPGFRLDDSYFLEVSIALPLPWRTGNDGVTKSFLIQSDLDLVITLASWIQARAGFGVQSSLVTSNGGEVTLDNGDGTSSFFLPDGFSIGASWTVQLGLSFPFTKRLSLNLDAYGVNVGSEASRQIHAALSFGVRL